MDVSAFSMLTEQKAKAGTAADLLGATVGTSSNVASTTKKPTDNALISGDEFLNVLNQVRSGSINKTSDAVFTAASAKADAVSLKSDKNIAATKQNIKILKLHIKRTRASETMQKADDTKAALKTAQTDGQKIPRMSNMALLNDVDETVPVAIDETGAIIDTDATVPEANRNQPQKTSDTFSSDEETTAADILMGVMLQPAVSSVTETVEKTSFVDFDADTNIPTDGDFQTKISKPAETTNAEAPVKAVEQTETTTETDPLFIENVAAGPVQTTTEQKHETVKYETKTVAGDEKMVTLENDDPILFDTAAEPSESYPVSKQTDLTAHTAKKTDDPKIHPQQTDMTTDTVFTQEEATYDDKLSDKQARHLAAQLPADTKIAISVTQTAETVSAPIFENQLQSFVKTDKTAKTERASVTDETETPFIEKTAEAPVTSAKISKIESADFQTEEHKNPVVQDTAQPRFSDIAPVTVNQSNFSTALNGATQVSASAIESVSPTNTTAQPAGQVLPMPQSDALKGKAVSGETAAHQPKAATPTNELADQIKVNITKALKSGLDKIDIVLRPKELGTIRVHLETDKDGHLKAGISSANADTLDLLKSDLSALKQSLADSGFSMDDNSFTFNYRGESFDREDRNQNNGKEFALTEETVLEQSTEGTDDSTESSGRYALNIRV